MKTSLRDCFAEIEDVRNAGGKRYDLPSILVMITMASMSQRESLRTISAFLNGNREELIEVLALKRTTMPCHQTIANVMNAIDVEQLIAAFVQWVSSFHQVARGDLISIDGKAIASTVTDPHTATQRFASVVSAFSQELGIVVAMKPYNNADTSEVSVVHRLVEQLDACGAVLTLDAVHCTKKRSRRSSTARTTMSSASRPTAAGCSPQ